MGLFDEFFGAANELRDAFMEPINEIKDSFTEGFSDLGDIKTDAADAASGLTDVVKEKMSDFTGK